MSAENGVKAPAIPNLTAFNTSSLVIQSGPMATFDISINLPLNVRHATAGLKKPVMVEDVRDVKRARVEGGDPVHHAGRRHAACPLSQAGLIANVVFSFTGDALASIWLFHGPSQQVEGTFRRVHDYDADRSLHDPMK